MNKDQVKGRLKEAKGEIKKGAGKLVGNKTLEVEGNVDKAAGKTQSAYGDMKKEIRKNT